MPETLISCEGGLDLRSAALSAPKGSLSACYNFEKDQGPGYVKRPGWVRCDGRVTGPEMDSALILQFSSLSISGSFLYGEQVRIQASTGALAGVQVNAIVIGFQGGNGFLILAYPVTTFTKAIDLTQLALSGTTVLGLVSGAQITALQSSKLLNDSTISVAQYDAYRQAVHTQHAAAVLRVPGRLESPVDAIFSFSNAIYSVHDCPIFKFSNGASATTIPQEGHVIRANLTGLKLGTILEVNVASGDWLGSGVTAVGTIVIYDMDINTAWPANTDRLDLYDATNTTLLQANFCRFVSNLASAADPSATRAALYSTYEQYVKDLLDLPLQYGPTSVPPARSTNAPTWTRVRFGRELPFQQAGASAAIGFGPLQVNGYSVYEYTRLGLTSDLNSLTPITVGPINPTTASESNTVTPQWTNVNGILSNATNATYATGLASQRVTEFITGVNFAGLSAIPADATILGLTFTMAVLDTVAVQTFTDFSVQLVGSGFAGGFSSTNKAAHDAGFTLALVDHIYGGANDTWGEQLTPQILQDPTFGVTVRFQRTATAAANPVMTTQNWRISVTYAPKTRQVYIRDPTAVTVTDVAATVVDYQIDSGDFLTTTATGVLTLVIGATEAAGTNAGKARVIGRGNEIRDQPSTGANVAHGNLLAYTAGSDYPITFPPSSALDTAVSRYEVVDGNFWDIPSARAAFICNGVEYATQFDGTYFVRIHTGRPAKQDNPRHVAIHGNPTPYLYLGFQAGTVSTTGGGHPTHYIGSPDPQTFVFGEPITGMLSVNGQTIGIWTDHSTRGLQGNNPATSTPFMISPAINCIEYTLVNLVGEAVWTSYRGVETLRTVNAYGDFETLPLSAAAQLFLQPRIQVDARIGNRPSRALYAIGIRNKRQYRLFFEDGWFYNLTLFDAGDLPVSTTGRLIRPNASVMEGDASAPYNNDPYNSAVIRHVYNATRSDGKELILATFENQNTTVCLAANGSTLGPYFPYGVRLDCSYTDDVLPTLPCWIEFNAFYTSYPTQSQQFASVTIFVQAYGGTIMSVYTKADYDGPIFDQAGNVITITSPLGPPSSDVQSETLTIPLIETKAWIPVPSRNVIYTIAAGGGNCLKMRIDGSQNNGGLISLPTSPVLMPMRITHLSFNTTAEMVKEA